MRFFLCLLITIFLFACNSKKSLYFFLPNKKILPQETISQIKKNHEVDFAQYEGFYIKEENSLFDSFFLIIDNQDWIDAETLPPQKISKLERFVIKKIIGKYTLKGNDSASIIRNRVIALFQNFTVVEKGSNVFIKNHCGEVAYKLTYSDFALPNFTLEIFPSKKECH